MRASAAARALAPAVRRAAGASVPALQQAAARGVAASCRRPAAPFGGALRGMASAGGFHGVIPRVQDKVVHVTFASPTGERRATCIQLDCLLPRAALPPAAGRGSRDGAVAAPALPLTSCCVLPASRPRFRGEPIPTADGSYSLVAVSLERCG